MGGKGYKPRKDYAGRRVSGDWENSDRGSGNKATRRSGGEVEVKSPTYLAHVHNKGKKKVDPEKNPVVGEAKVDDVKYGKGKGWDQPEGKSMTSYKARHSYLKKNPANVRSDRNERHSAQDVVFHGHDKVERDRKKKHHASKGVKKVKGAKVDSGGKEALKKRFQDSGAMEAYQSDWRNELTEAERKLSDRLARKRKLYDKTTKKAMRDAMETGEASGHNRFRMGSLDREMDGIKARMKKKDVKEAKVDAGLSPEEKEKKRNIRRFGVSHNVAAHAKLRRSLAKMNRGDKKIPGDKSKWTEMESVQVEARQEQGRSDYGKASVRNKRRFGKEGEPALFDPSNERGAMIDQRRAENKEKRGVKKEAVDIQKTEDQATKKMNLIKKQLLMKKLQAVRSGGGVDIVASHQPELYGWRKTLGEEDYDKIKDARLVNYGIGHDGSDKKGPSSSPSGKKSKGKTVLQKETEKKYGKGVSAMDVTRAKIEKEHGKGAIAK